MYVWHTLSHNNDELIHRIYQTQKNSSSVGDWFRLVEADKHELGIDMTDEEIQCVSQEVFKTFVKKKVKISYLHHINSLKAKHSKSEFQECTDVKMSEYLKDPRLSNRKKQLLLNKEVELWMSNKISKIRIKTHGVLHVASFRRYKAISCSALHF